ncbi:hypothetical protein [Alkanindiges illinoisensis]|uniref:Uncharacterized protein n=1 Tax=Alkanindiges illinoisensis TaxID=197183 RepID=A0A4Y7XBB4_9GAMM|nr:hypothetical protein [Alkanindiges illinoisensis]TEU25601.1 hypothetical protein E2B99_09570 [Alkanindiges illinoisensis]
MAARPAFSQQQWVGINYGLMLLSVLLGFGVLIALWSSHHFLNQSQDVWLRSHHLWIMRSCVGLLALVVFAALFLLPLFWLPVTQGIGFYSAITAASMGGLATLWLIYRSVKGLLYWSKGKVIY